MDYFEKFMDGPICIYIMIQLGLMLLVKLANKVVQMLVQYDIPK